jgi:transcriptional regulator with XRE-family HTH domain
VPSKPGSLSIRRKIGERIRVLREEAGLTQEAVAWAADLSKPHLSRVESGENLPSVSVLFRIAKELGVEPADLLAYDLRKPRVLLLDAARRRDEETLRGALVSMDLLAADQPQPAPVQSEGKGQAAERASTPKVSGKRKRAPMRRR